ncbi:permease [Streptomyces sp. NPDC048566]|uniref:permease n=1 Tax=Streptomyces sp. NPDC048566 TaxID=3365569 RepID=UPI0037134CEE
MAAASVLAAAFLGLAAIHAAYDGRTERAQARSPVFTQDRSKAVAMWAEDIDSTGTVPHNVYLVRPLRPDAPPPPGLSRWPKPGEVMMSPELAHAGGTVTARYGRLAGGISPQGLASPSERLAYAQPKSVPDKAEYPWFYISSFGTAGTPFILAGADGSETQMVLAFAALTLVPALALAVIAVRVGSHGRDRRSHLIHALGGTWRHRAVLNMAEAVVPTASGTLLAGLIWAVGMTHDVRLPFTRYVVAAHDLRTHLPTAAGALAASLASLLLLAVLLHRVARKQSKSKTGTRPVVFDTRIPVWRQAGFVGGVLIIAFAQYLTGIVAVAAFVTGTICLWVFLPSVAAQAAAALGRRFARRGRTSGNAGQLIGGRWTQTRPGVIVRLTTAMIIALGLMAQMQVWNSRHGESVRRAEATQGRIGDTVIAVNGSHLTTGLLGRLDAAFPPGTHVILATDQPEDHTMLLQGSCPALTALNLRCTSTPTPVRQAVTSAGDLRMVDEIAAWYSPNVTAQEADLSHLHAGLDRSSLLAVTRELGHLTQVKQAVFRVVPTATVEELGGSLLIGAYNRERNNDWINLFGLAGLLFLLTAGAVSAGGEFARTRTSLAPLAVITGNREVFGKVTFWHLTVPLLVCTAIAGLVTSVHSVFFVATVKEGTVTWASIGAGVTVCAAVSLIIGAIAGRSSVKAAALWRPTGD